VRLHVVLRLEQQRSDLGKHRETLFCVSIVAEREQKRCFRWWGYL